MVNIEFNIIIGRPCSGKSSFRKKLAEYYKKENLEVIQIDFDYIESLLSKEKLKPSNLLILLKNNNQEEYQYKYNKSTYLNSRKLIYELIESIIYDQEKLFDIKNHSKNIMIILDDVMNLNSEREKYLKILIKNFINFCFIYFDISKEICIKRNNERKWKILPESTITNVEYNFQQFYKKEFYIRFKSNKESEDLKEFILNYKNIKKLENIYFEKIKNKLILLERNKTINEEVNKYFVKDNKIQKLDKNIKANDKKLNTIQNLKDIEIRNYIKEINEILSGKSNTIPNSSDVHMLINFLKKLNMESKVLHKVLSEKKKEFLKLEDTKKVSNIKDLRSKFSLFIINL